MKIEVYTKTDCIWCVRTKELLNALQLNYTELKLYVDFTREQLREKLKLESKDRLFLPQVFINDASIGGYEDTAEYLEQTGVMGLQS